MSILNEQSIDIIIDYDAYQAIRKYAQNNLSCELNGVLVGKWKQTGAKTEVHVRGAVDAPFTKTTKSGVRYTRKTWQYIDEVKERCFAYDDKIVGWFSSHPGIGLFLQGPKGFADGSDGELPGQVAFVLDPVTNNEDFFYWQDDAVARCSYRIEELGYDNGNYQLQPVAGGGRNNYITQSKFVLAGLCLLLVAALSYSAGLFHGKSMVDVGNSEEQQAKSEFVGDQLTREPSKQNTSPPAVSNNATKTVYEHQVKPGENLWVISMRYYNNGDGMRKIAEYNNLPNMRALTPGQILIIPDVEKVDED